MWRAARKGSPEVLRVSESSPDSAETSFRELDDVFLQTQTRIWLGEVLHVRFDEDVGIADSLADGELLFQVSKEVWKMLLKKHGELKHSKVHIYERTTSGKSDGRYMPYPKVDSFLKICQILGLTGIDLFSPSDVVEKWDIRRVCMCIRSLSKKARSKKLNVPDFDIVTYTIAMPTHLVGGIRRNLELSQCSPSNSSASSPWNDSKEICGLKIPFGQHSQHSDSGSDESVSNLSDLFESPFLSASYEATNITSLVGETSPELAPVVDKIIHETSFNNSIEDSNHYEHVDEHQQETFAESICSCDLSTAETYTLQSLSSSSYSEQPTDQDASVCFLDIGKGSAGSIPKDVKNGLKVEDLARTLDVESSYQAYMNASSLNVAPSEDNRHSQSSSPSIFSHFEVHNNVKVEPCNVTPAFENAIATNNKATKNRFYYMETSDDSNSVTPKSYSLDPEADGNDGNLSSEIKSTSILDLNSLANYACDSESQFKCSISSSMCFTCNDESIEDGSNLVADNCLQENDVSKSNFTMDLNEASINTLVPVVQEDVDITAHSLSLEEKKICNDASSRSFEGQFMSSSLNSGTKVGSNIENAEQIGVSYHSCKTQENLLAVAKGNLSEEPCVCYNFHLPHSVSKNTMKKCASELIENHGISSNYKQGKDYGCICGSMLDGSSISGLPSMVSAIPEQPKSPEKVDTVELTDGSFYGISSVDDSDYSDQLKMHQSSHDASDIAFLLSGYESKIPPNKKGRATNVVDEESSVNPESCHDDDGKMRDFGYQMTKKLNSFHAKDLELLDVMESTDFACGACAYEMIPSFDLCRYDLFSSGRNSLETEDETFQTIDNLPSSTPTYKEGREITSDESIEVEKQVVSYNHDACAKPNNASQAILDNNTVYQKETIMPNECGKNEDREGKTVGKPGNQVLKSVAGVMTMVGALILFLHVRHKKYKEKNNETGLPFQIQKPNKEFFTTRQIKIGKSDSLYPGEKLKF